MNPEINFANDPFLSDYENEQIKNFCSWLLNFKQYDLPVLTYAIAVVLAKSFTIQERTVIGSIFSTLGVVLPSFIIILIISYFIEQFMTIKIVKYAFVGINSAVAFLILKTGFTFYKKMEKKLIPIICFIIVFGLMILFELLSISFSTLLYIIIGGVIGIVAYGIMNICPKEDK